MEKNRSNGGLTRRKPPGKVNEFIAATEQHSVTGTRNKRRILLNEYRISIRNKLCIQTILIEFDGQVAVLTLICFTLHFHFTNPTLFLALSW